MGKLQVGQQATFRVDAFPEAQYTGVVRQIRLNPTTQQNVVTYDVVVDVDNKELNLLPGMTAYVDIILEQRNKVLLLPNAALRFKPQVSKDKKSSSDTAAAKSNTTNRGLAKVYVLENGQPKELRVKTGISNGKFTEVLSDELKISSTVIVGDSQATNTKPANIRGF